LHIKSKLLER